MTPVSGQMIVRSLLFAAIILILSSASAYGTCTKGSGGCLICSADSTVCTNCSNTYSLNSTTGQCYKCGTNCNICNAPNSCTTCISPAYGPNPDGSCSLCDTSCPNKCAKNGGGCCDSCTGNNGLTNQTCPVCAACFSSGCVSGCQVSGAGKCDGCDSAYILTSNGECQTCSLPSCQTCLNGTYCLVCLPDYVQVNGACIECPDNCLDCPAYGPQTCLQCNQGYYYDPTDGTCSDCSVYHCNGTCTGDGQCTGACDDGYGRNATSYCALCEVQNCSTCSTVNNCTGCNDKFILQTGGSVCLPCSDNCQVCPPSGNYTCSTCDSGYYFNTCTNGCLTMTSGPFAPM